MARAKAWKAHGSRGLECARARSCEGKGMRGTGVPRLGSGTQGRAIGMRAHGREGAGFQGEGSGIVSVYQSLPEKNKGKMRLSLNSS